MNKTKTTRSIIRIDEDKCTGCGDCVPACVEGAIRIIDGKAKLVSETYCDGLGACLGHCPEDAITIEEREAAEFDEAAVAEFLENESKASGVAAPGQHAHAGPRAHAPNMPAPARPMPAGPDRHPAGLKAILAAHQGGGGCPSAAVRSMKPREQSPTDSLSGQASTLTQWPIQLHLVPPSAPFLQGAHLLIAADCVPFAYASFHNDLLKGRAVLIACPKLDDTEPYVAKLTRIFESSGIQSVTVAHMEVPCCFGLLHLVESAMRAAGKEIPVRTVNIGIDGEVRQDSANDRAACAR